MGVCFRALKVERIKARRTNAIRVNYSEEKYLETASKEMTKSESEELGSNDDLSGGAAKPQSGKRSDVSDKKKNKG